MIAKQSNITIQRYGTEGHRHIPKTSLLDEILIKHRWSEQHLRHGNFDDIGLADWHVHRCKRSARPPLGLFVDIEPHSDTPHERNKVGRMLFDHKALVMQARDSPEHYLLAANDDHQPHRIEAAAWVTNAHGN